VAGKHHQLGKSKERRLNGNLAKPTLKAWTDATLRKKNVSDSILIVDAMDTLTHSCLIGRSERVRAEKRSALKLWKNVYRSIR
jgi:hypothetical protein